MPKECAKSPCLLGLLQVESAAAAASAAAAQVQAELQAQLTEQAAELAAARVEAENKAVQVSNVLRQTIAPQLGLLEQGSGKECATGVAVSPGGACL